ncbi:MAG: DUF4199 domain-containing protein [Bacteroidales bacterium]
MEEQKSSLFKNALNWGVIMGIVLVIYSLIMWFIGLSLEKWTNWLSYLFVVVILILATINYRDKVLGGFMSYGQALGFGILVILIGVVISSIYNYIFMTFIDPEIINKMLAMQEEDFLKSGLTDDQIDRTMEMTKKFMTPLVISIMIIPVSVFFGFIITLITSIFLKKEKPEMQLNE